MLDELISAYGSNFLVAALGVSLALLCLFIVLWLLRNRAPSPFVRGGRNRQPRLQVLDAAAIDTRRRIVLIRRDNVEHLVMIGGPTDLLIETGIGDERHYLNARALQTPVAEEEARLARQAAASLPAAEPDQTPRPAASLATDSIVASPLASLDRDPPRNAPQPPAGKPAAAQVPEDTSRAVERSAEVPQPRPAPVSERPAEDRVMAAPMATASQKTPIAHIPAAVAAPPALSVNPAPLPMASPGPASVGATPFVAPSMPIMPVPAKAPEPATGSASPSVAALEAPLVSASFAPELHGEPAVLTPIAPRPEPAQPQVAPSAAPIVDLAPTNLPEQPASVASPPVSANPALATAVSIEPERPHGTQALDLTQQTPFTSAPAIEVDSTPAIDAPIGFEVTPLPDAAPTVSMDASGQSAEDVLEAARARVLSSPTAAPFSRPFDADRFAPARQTDARLEPQPAESPAARDLSDFERVLEEEMALHIAADPGPLKPQASTAPTVPALLPETRPDRPRPPIGAMVAEPRPPATPATANPAQPAEEPNLQNEIARIFGEMSASRNP
jgi:Flagellar biosynthesis protein, FliO